ncbi:hypothetical protein EZ428_11855 [Pedobacter frigiditerrae]|uniref:Uncharacterized protein n=1 Tax=Pedobacter frigiditerrae TaxID=2530452 RepID=A0A4R0MZI8_9SPHI|nr:hypothetical protein [Pedobacter frigiditerrae]TCC92407.1 hypothetical protein EZ428_11855 [Pedobacter frigiditerrae]
MIGNSWRELSPNGNLIDVENFSVYANRVYATGIYQHIPEAVLEQWIYMHHDNEWMIKNYAWMDYTTVKFELQEWTVEQLQGVKAIDAFENSITGIEDEFNSVCALEEDELYWEQYGTWRVPPIILDTSSVIGKAPTSAELHQPYQLVEGHSRLRNLLISDYQNLFVAGKHLIFFMQALGD